MPRPVSVLGFLFVGIVVLLAACGGAPVATPSGLVSGTALAGPTCPVVSVPPDPGCAPRAVAGATIVAVDASGRTVAQTVTGADGRYALTLPHGRFSIGAQPLQGYFAVSEPVIVDVDGRDIAHVADFAYDTGIR